MEEFVQLELWNDTALTDDAQNEPSYDGDPSPTPATVRNGVGDEIVIDRDGEGINLSILIRNLNQGLIDLERLKAICLPQSLSTASATGLAQAISGGHFAAQELLACAQLLERDVGYDAYMCDLISLAKQSRGRRLSGLQIEQALSTLRDQFGVKQKTIERDLKSVEKQLGSKEYYARVGIVSRDEVASISRMEHYAARFAIVNTGGRAAVVNLEEHDLAKAVMGASDFVRFHYKDWYRGPKGQPIKRAKEFLDAPPSHAKVYPAGFVFKPAGIVRPDEYNLYRGFNVQPDASGSCSLFHDLINDVWAHGDEAVYQWVVEWLMHVLAYPGEKVGTSLAIRGGQGDGKSILFENLMSHILGDMQLRVANRDLILGNFNEALMGKLVTVLEEACFGNDLASFDKMKELVTGRTITINPKHKAPITVANLTRLAVISNHDYFLNVPGDDRRYTVLESASAWNGTEKFEQLVEQWHNGGAERFLHEALNHSFRQFDDRQKLIIQSNLKTEAAVRQRAQSRTPLQVFLVRCLLTGRWNAFGAGPVWQLDQTLTIASRDLEMLAKQSSSDDATPVSLHKLVPELERLVGPLKETRPKAPADDATGKRRQLPTLRVLPSRSQALDHARSKGLITLEEHEAGLSAEPEAADTEFIEQVKEWAEDVAGDASTERLQ